VTESSATRLCRLAERAAQEDDPVAALEALTAAGRELEAAIREQVARALATGRSYGELSRPLGISRQAAHRRFRDVAPPRAPGRPTKVVVSPAARHVLRIARTEAQAYGSTTVAGAHVLAAILRCGGPVAAILHQEGVTSERLRRCMHAVESGPDSAAAVRDALLGAARCALARGSRQVEVDDVALSALAADGGARGILAVLDVDVASLRRRLGSHVEAPAA
jgi:ATP-dependent Clp protease ATP-binding subunit ClpA